jgi:hypothetical protein
MCCRVRSASDNHITVSDLCVILEWEQGCFGPRILDFQPPAAYLGDEQMLRILGRGRSVPTVTENGDPVIVPQSAKCFNCKMVKHCALTPTL